MLQLIISIAIIAFIIDGIKLLIESNSKITERSGTSNPDETTIVLSAYNEDNIIDSIETMKPHAKKLIIVNDNSTDDTLLKLKSLGKITSIDVLEDHTHIKMTNGDTSYLIIDNHENINKVPSIHYALDFVETKYTFICDADIYLNDDFVMPVSLLNHTDDPDNQIDSVSFSILPKVKEKNSIWTNILLGLQLHEYHKSMNIGRQFANNSKSVECISGAAGLFKTERIMKLKNVHSNEFCGEDLERTLLELFDKGKTVFSDQVIDTDVPETFRSLTKQRVTGWWPGLYRTFPLLFRIMRTKGIENRLRFEMIYNIVSTILDPFKFISLWLVLFVISLPVLAALYIVYLLFEIYMYFRIKKRTSYDVKYSPLQIILYPIYGIIQLHYRIFAMIRLIYMKLTKKVKPLRYKELALSLILIGSIGLTSVMAQTDTESTDYHLTLQYSQYNFQDQWNPNYLIYVGRNNLYAQYHYGLYNQVNVGGYFGNFLIDFGYRRNVISFFTIYEHWLGNNTIRGIFRYNMNFNSVDTQLYPNTPVVGLGYGRYQSNWRITVDLLRELDREESFILVGRYTQSITSRLSTTTTASINDSRDYVLGKKIMISPVYVFGTYYSNFDYTNLDYLEIGIGLQF